jgi:hypothetical protein
MFWVSAAVFAIVFTFVLGALASGMRRVRTGIASTSDQTLRRSVAATVGMTVLILFAPLAAFAVGFNVARGYEFPT